MEPPSRSRSAPPHETPDSAGHVARPGIGVVMMMFLLTSPVTLQRGSVYTQLWGTLSAESTAVSGC